MKKIKKILILLICLFCFINCGDAQSKLKKATGITSEQEEKINQILLEAGFGNDIVKIEHDEVLDGGYSKDGKGYRADFKLDAVSGISNVTLYFTKENDLERIRYNTKNFYKDNKVVDNVRNHVILFNEQDEYMRFCTKNIQSLLKAPSTAKFPNITHWKMSKDDGKVIIQSYVDAQNGFGAMIRSQFQFVINTKTKTVTSLIFDGQEYIKQSKKKKK